MILALKTTSNHWQQAALLMLLLMIFLAGCRQPPIPLDNPDVQIAVTIAPHPPAIGDATLTIIVLDADDTPIDDARLDIRGDMTHAGMIPVLRTVQGGQNGVYEVPFEWTMGGDWWVEIIATRSDGTAGRAIFEYTLTEE